MEWWQAEQIVEAAAQTDPNYRDILKRRDAARALYEDVLQTLTPEQREAVESYTYFDVELEHQKTRLAYFTGRSHGAAAVEKNPQ